MSRRRLSFLGVCLLLLAVSACRAPQPKPDADTVGAIRKIQTVAILPPHIEYRRMLSNGDSERLADSEDFIASDLNPRLERFRSQNFAIPRPSTEKVDLEPQLAQLNAAFVKALNERNTPARLSLPVAADLAKSFNADAVLFSRFYSIRRTDAEWAAASLAGLSGEVLMALATRTPGRSQTYAPHKQIGTLIIALIDGRNGEVVWFAENAVLPNSPPFNYERTSAQSVPGALDNIFWRFPAKEVKEP